jgi:hypothetical protein
MAEHDPILPPLDPDIVRTLPPEARPVLMTHTAGDPPLGYGYDLPREQRYDGWTAEKQRVFLAALSEGHTVAYGCRAVRMSQQSAYALRRAARGAAFALGWQAALLLARDRLADEMMDRAINGVIEEVALGNGQIAERRRFDNRLSMAVLARLDRLVDQPEPGAANAAARLVAQDFEQYLDLVDRDASPARAGLFLGARLQNGPVPASEDDLAPIRTLARTDTWLRTRTDLADGIDTADLLPDDRKDWTGEQWRRAEAAGLVALAPAPEAEEEASTPPETKLNQLVEYRLPSERTQPVWWDEIAEEWRTRFPPPEGFDGHEDCEFGDAEYSRELTPEEEEVADGPRRDAVEARTATETLERDAWFGFTPTPPAEEDEEDDDWEDDDWEEDEDEENEEDDEEDEDEEREDEADEVEDAS